jgi:hypothetical protein
MLLSVVSKNRRIRFKSRYEENHRVAKLSSPDLSQAAGLSSDLKNRTTICRKASKPSEPNSSKGTLVCSNLKVGYNSSVVNQSTFHASANCT